MTALSATDDTRARILDAARELFVARGVEATTMRAIAGKLGVSAPAIYHHFADKHALIQELVVTDLHRLATAFARAQRVRDPIERLKELGLAYVRFGLENPQLYRLLFMTPDLKAGAEEEIQHALEATPERDAYGIVRTCAEAAIGAGRLGPTYRDAEQVSQALWASVHGIVALHVVFACEAWIEWRETLVTAELLIDATLAGMQIGAASAAG